MPVLERIVDFLRHLLERHDHMATSLAAILATLNDQSTKLDAQGAQIDSLLAAKSAQEQADLEQIETLLTANAAKSDANAAKLTSALAANGSVPGQAKAAESSGPIAAVVTAPTVAGTTTIPVAQVVVAAVASAVDDATATGSSATISGPGVAPGTTVTSVDAAALTITVSDPTVASHAGDGTETLTVTPPPAAAAA